MAGSDIRDGTNGVRDGKNLDSGWRECKWVVRYEHQRASASTRRAPGERTNEKDGANAVPSVAAGPRLGRHHCVTRSDDRRLGQARQRVGDPDL